jgi:Domain of unknown function (DUF5050)
MHLRTLTAAVIGTVVMCSGAVALASPVADAPPPPHVYWADGYTNSIGESNLDGSDSNPNFITGVANPNGVAVAEGHIYWSNTDTDTIGRANLDGTDVNQSFIAGASAPTQLAVHRNRIYWCNVRTNEIAEANLAGSDVNQSLINVGDCGGVAVNDQHIYFSSDAGPFIGDANLDGSDVNYQFIEAGAEAKQIALTAQHIYWTTIGFGEIGEANVDGTNVNANIIPNQYSYALAATNEHLLWDADIQTGPSSFATSLAESNLAGGEVDENLLTGSQLNALAVSPSAQQPEYRFRKVDNTKDATFNRLLGINRFGMVAGYFGSGAQGHPNQAYVVFPQYGQRNFASENHRRSVQTQVTGLNDRGATVGFWSDENTASGMNDNVGFYSLDGRHFHNVNFRSPVGENATPPVNQLLGVNDNDVAVGFYTDAAGNNHGYIYDLARNRFKHITIPGANSVTATAINNRGDIAGFENGADGNVHGFLLSADGRVTTLDAPGAGTTRALGVNDHDEVVGVYKVGTGSAATAHGFTWTLAGGFQTVDDPGAVGATIINGVNDQGQIVGFYTDGGGNTDGLLATRSCAPATESRVASRGRAAESGSASGARRRDALPRRGTRRYQRAGQLAAGAHIELVVDVAEVRLDSAVRDEQRLGDLPVRLSIRGEFGDPQFARGE